MTSFTIVFADLESDTFQNRLCLNFDPDLDTKIIDAQVVVQCMMVAIMDKIHEFCGNEIHTSNNLDSLKFMVDPKKITAQFVGHLHRYFATTDGRLDVPYLYPLLSMSINVVKNQVKYTPEIDDLSGLMVSMATDGDVGFLIRSGIVVELKEMDGKEIADVNFQYEILNLNTTLVCDLSKIRNMHRYGLVSKSLSLE